MYSLNYIERQARSSKSIFVDERRGTLESVESGPRSDIGSAWKMSGSKYVEEITDSRINLGGLAEKKVHATTYRKSARHSK